MELSTTPSLGGKSGGVVDLGGKVGAVNWLEESLPRDVRGGNTGGGKDPFWTKSFLLGGNLGVGGKLFLGVDVDTGIVLREWLLVPLNVGVEGVVRRVLLPFIKVEVVALLGKEEVGLGRDRI